MKKRDVLTVIAAVMIAAGLVLGALFAAAVVWFFLRRFRPTLIAGLAIPSSIIATFAVIHFLGFTINTLTMLALVLAVGVVIDDSVVVLENIYRHRGLGDSVHDSVIVGTKEVAGAITSSTITTAAVFLPTT